MEKYELGKGIKKRKFGNTDSYGIKNINRKLQIRTVNPIYREIELKVDA